MVYVENKRKELKTDYDYPDKTVLNLVPVLGSNVSPKERIGIK